MRKNLFIKLFLGKYYAFIESVINKENVDSIEIFTKENLENEMESYLIEYNKTVSN